MKIKLATRRESARNAPAQLERMAAPPYRLEKRTLIIHHFAWHRIITALAFLTLAAGAVL